MRKVPTILAAVALLFAALPTAASAQAAVHFSEVRTFVECDYLTASTGTANFIADVSNEFGGFAALDFWADPASPDYDPPTWTTGEAQVSLSEDGSELNATLELYEFVLEEPGAIVPDATGQPGPFVGEATATLTLTPDGDPVPFSGRTTGGTNQKQRVEGTDQFLAVSGEIVLPDQTTFDDLSGCFAVRESVSVFYNAPDSYVARSSSINLMCQWADEDSFVFLDGYSDGVIAFSDVFVATSLGTYSGGADAVLTASDFSAYVDLYQEPPMDAVTPAATGPGDPVGYAQAQATLTSTGTRIRSIERQGSTKFKVSSQLLSVDGTLLVSLPEGDLSLDMSDATCSASVDRIQVIQSTPASQEHGKPSAERHPGDRHAHRHRRLGHGAEHRGDGDRSGGSVHDRRPGVRRHH